MVERLFLAVPRGCLQFVIVVFPDHTHLLFSNGGLKVFESWTVCMLLNPLYTEKTYTGNLTNREDPDKMQHNAAFYLDLHRLLMLKQPSGTEIHHKKNVLM